MKKRQVIVSLIFLLITILVLPALIVLPFIHSPNTKEEKNTTPTQLTTSSRPVPNPLSKALSKPLSKPLSPEAAIPVSVFRSNSKTIDDLTLHNYLVGVVASEMPADFQMEALKAQAIAARTYTVDRLLGNTTQNGLPNGAKMIDTTQDQVYHDPSQLKKLWGSAYSQNLKRIEQAVTATQGKIITYKGRIIQTPTFFSTSNGYTEDAQDYWSGSSVPYLKSVPSKWDLNASTYKSVRKMSVQSVQKALGVQLPVSDGIVGTVICRTNGKRIAQIKLGGKVFTGRSIRQTLNLRSTDFKLKRENSTIYITTYGFGHGIGMSQYGANAMAKEGKTYQQILEYYYTGVNLSSMTSLMNELKTSV